MASSVGYLTEELQEIKISDECFFGEDLSNEKGFLEGIEDRRSSKFEVLFITNEIYQYLRAEWDDSEEMNFLTPAMDALDNEINPKRYSKYPGFYLDTLKLYYRKNKDE